MPFERFKKLKDILSGAAGEKPKAPPAPPQSTEGIKREIDKMQAKKKAEVKKKLGGY